MGQGRGRAGAGQGQGRVPPGWEENLKNQPQNGKYGNMGRKRENWGANGKLVGSLPLRTGRASWLRP